MPLPPKTECGRRSERLDGVPGNLARPVEAGPPLEPQSTDRTPLLMITAEEAWPVFETLFLEARKEVRMGFRIFDLSTPLYSPRAREVGRDWFDLVIHTLGRGVDVWLALADFDPVVGAEIHRLTWRSMRMFAAAEELARASGATGRLRVIAALHPASVAPIARLALYLNIRAEIVERIGLLRSMKEAVRDRALAEMPGLSRHVLRHGPKVRASRWPVPELIPATHHQKMAVFDRERLYIGGLDLNPRRFDTKVHDRPAADTWHDVQVLVDGPVAADAHAHLAGFLDECARRRPVEPKRGRLLRTLSTSRSWQGVSMSPRPAIREIEAAHLDALEKVERFVYLESQFFRSRHVARALAAAARRNPHLTCILLLPAAPEELAFENRSKPDMRYGEFLQARCLRKIERAFGDRLFVATPAAPRRMPAEVRRAYARAGVRAAPLVYVHAKVSIFDDSLCLVTSANLNGRSMRWDTEAGVAFTDPAVVRRFRDRLFAHWLPEEAGREFYAPSTAKGAWARLGAENAARAPERRRGFVMPYDTDLAEAFGADLPVIPEEMV